MGSLFLIQELMNTIDALSQEMQQRVTLSSDKKADSIFIDHFHKWWPIINSFASIKISLTDLILKLIIQKKFYSETRLVRLI